MALTGSRMCFSRMLHGVFRPGFRALEARIYLAQERFRGPLRPGWKRTESRQGWLGTAAKYSAPLS